MLQQARKLDVNVYIAHLHLTNPWYSEQDAEVADARLAAQKVLEVPTDPYKAKCVQLECLLQAKDTHIAHLEVSYILSSTIALEDCLSPSARFVRLKMKHKPGPIGSG